MSAAPDQPLVELAGVSVEYGRRRSLLRPWAQPVRAVERIDLAIDRGQVVGLVGESGSGKTSLGRAILGLERPSDGAVRFERRDIGELDTAGMRVLRQRMQMIPQDAAASLSPRMSVRQLLDEVYVIRGVPERRCAEDLLAMVELNPEHADKYPHELSGGQAKRVAIARALAMEPDFLVADEPTAGLDVSAVAGIINLLMRLRDERGLTYLLITHDLDAVAYMADVVAVMYLGRVVERGPAEALVDAPRHPYTRALLAAVSRPGERAASPPIRGDIPSPLAPPPGCRFHTRCPHVQPLCRTREPELEWTGAHGAACHFWREIATARPPIPPAAAPSP